MKKIAIAITLALCLLMIPTANAMAAGVTVVDKSGEGEWIGNTWQVQMFPGETKSTTIKLYNSASRSLAVWVSVTPNSQDNGNLIFELDKSSFVMPGKSYTDVTLSVNASGSATPGTYSTGLEIKSEVPSTPSLPGPGPGPGRDTSPPVISDILVFGITETSANISWKTDEMSDSQVEYWSSPSEFSPLDTGRVIYHLVHLTGLVSNTTYYYKVMSKDAAGNLAVSSEQTFTTLETPFASFSITNLLISPSEVDIGENVTISILVTNTGDVPGSYEAVLKINGVVEVIKGVTLNAGASEEILFTTVKDVAGGYSVEVSGLEGSFTVREKLEPPVTPTFPIWAIIGVIVAAGLLLFFLVRRKRAAK